MLQFAKFMVHLLRVQIAACGYVTIHCVAPTCLVITSSSMTDDSMICINIKKIYIYIYQHGQHIYLDSYVNIHI